MDKAIILVLSIVAMFGINLFVGNVAICGKPNDAWAVAGALPQKFEGEGQRREVRCMREPVRGLGGPAP